MSALYCRTCSIGVCANAIDRPSASVRICAASGIVRTSPAMSISRRFNAAASVNARAPNQPAGIELLYDIRGGQPPGLRLDLPHAVELAERGRKGAGADGCLAISRHGETPSHDGIGGRAAPFQKPISLRQMLVDVGVE